MRLRDLPLSSRIAGSAMILVALGALALLFVEEAYLRKVYFGQRRAHLENAFQTSELRLAGTFEALRQDVRFLANVPPVAGIMRAAGNNGYDARDGNTRRQWEERLRQIFAPFLLARSDYQLVSYIGIADHGREILRLVKREGEVEIMPAAALRSAAGEEYYRAALALPPGRVFLSEACWNREEGAGGLPGGPVIHAATPVFATDGTVFGLIVIGMDLRPLLRSAGAGLPADVSTFIADRRGRYLFHPERAAANPPPGTAQELQGDFPELARLLDPRAVRMLPLGERVTRGGAAHLAAGRIHYDPDDPQQFLLLTYRLSGEMARRFTAIPRHHVVNGFVVLLFICGGVFLLLRRTFAPLEELTAAAAAIAAGNRELRLPAGTGGEIGSLTATINTMLTELAGREREIVRINEGLEEQVAARTKDLTTVNVRLLDTMRERELALHEAGMLLQRHQALMETAMDGIHILDLDGNLLEANLAFCRMVGHAKEEVVGLTVADWDAQWSVEELLPRFRSLIGSSILIETVYRRKDGTTFPVEIACSGVEIGGKGYLYAASRDISGRREAEAVLRRHEVIIETARDGFWLADMNGILLEVNAAYAEMSGYTAEELVGMHISDLEAREQLAEVKAHIEALLTRGYECFETRHRHKDGHEIDIEISATYLPEAGRFFVFCRDITERKRVSRQLQHQQELLKEAQRLGKLGSWELDVASGELHWSEEVYRIFELDSARFTPSYENFLRVLHPEDRGLVDHAYRQSLRDYQPYNIEHRLLFVDGRVKWVREHCTTTFDVSGQPLRSVGMVQDITERKQAEEEIRSLALHDHLTGLPNRRFFLERLRAARAASVRHGDYGAVLFVDLDRFKAINDTYGHETGDLLLIEVAARLTACIRAIDTVSRFGGDEFVVLIEQLGGDAASARERAGLVAEKMRQSLARPYGINGHEHHSSPSIGVALFLGKRESVDALLQQADTAMYQAKNAGRNRVCFHDPAVPPEG